MPEQTLVQIFRLEEKTRRHKSGSFFLRIGLLALFLLTPLLFPSFKTFDLITNIIIFATLAASFDIMLGYTGIISFGHSMFFGIGAYCVGFLIARYGAPTYGNLILAFILAVAVSSALALIISLISMRVKAIFFAMVTLAIAEFAIILAIKMSGFTGGEDGISISRPGIFAASASLGNFMGVEITGRVATYYFIFLVCLGLFLLMLRFINSPLGRVLQAIRDNVQRAEALGYKTFIFQAVSITFGCVIASITGGLYAMWLGFVNPEACMHIITIMLSVLLMCIIGGMGTLYGGIIGAAFLMIAETFLPDLQKLAQDLFPEAVSLHRAMERWFLIFGVLFILVVVFFPKGVMGSVRDYMARRKAAALYRAQEKGA